jgi:hypothetical protein
MLGEQIAAAAAASLLIHKNGTGILVLLRWIRKFWLPANFSNRPG